MKKILFYFLLLLVVLFPNDSGEVNTRGEEGASEVNEWMMEIAQGLLVLIMALCVVFVIIGAFYGIAFIL